MICSDPLQLTRQTAVLAAGELRVKPHTQLQQR